MNFLRVGSGFLQNIQSRPEPETETEIWLNMKPMTDRYASVRSGFGPFSGRLSVFSGSTG